jgi:hypothetical protein
VLILYIHAFPCVFEGVGFGQMFATLSTATYYCLLMGITVFYMFASFQNPLPWQYCDRDDWADENCVDSSSNVTDDAADGASAPEQYFTQVYGFFFQECDDSKLQFLFPAPIDT